VLDTAALRARLADVRERMSRAAGRAGRDPASIRLVAISKTFSIDYIRAAADDGQRDFGENKVQEALTKLDRAADLGLRWHLVGHLQSNKAKKAAERFDVIQSVDSAALLRKLDEGAAASGRTLDVLVQVDLAREPTKHGAPEPELPELFAAGRDCRAARIVGLMLLPPAVDDPDDARPYFRALCDVRSKLLDRGTNPAMLAELSMGMSHDFEAAIEEGATMVRVGSAIFGDRATV
jgi:pyridoxal phosphate enzyme (YggS family)